MNIMEEQNLSGNQIINNQIMLEKKVNWWLVIFTPLFQVMCIVAMFMSGMFFCFDSCSPLLYPTVRFLYAIFLISPFLSLLFFTRPLDKERKYPWFSIIINLIIPILFLMSGIKIIS